VTEQIDTAASDTKRFSREGGVLTIENLYGPSGRLEAILNEPRAETEGATPPPVSVLLCHPHPLFGGTLHNKVVYHAMKAFSASGLPVLRFNFRGTGRSEGIHDFGEGEQDDARAGLAWLKQRYGLPVIAAGFSFGANVALRAGATDPDVVGLVSLGTPIEAGDRRYTYEFLAACIKPKLFVSGSADSFGPVAQVEAVLSAVPQPKQLVWIEGADHFFVGNLSLMQDALRAWLRTYVVPGQTPDTGFEEVR
jgi:alpha/beta superfamily hydrolase